MDYEKIADNQNRRLIFFGRYAGLAGMINSLWSFGVRMEKEGKKTRFSRVKQSHHYNSLDEAKEVLLQIGREIREHGMPEDIAPLTIGVTGYGNVSKGAQEIIDLLPVEEITPAELHKLKESKRVSNKLIYKIVFKEEDISKPKDESIEFNLDLYFKHPELFENNFEQYVPHLSILMNCMYWDDNYPRIVTKNYLKDLFTNEEEPKLKVIGDITCDPDGSIECTHIGTMIEDPVFVYNPHTMEPTMGFDGDGILVMSVDILPSELPRDASQSFGDALFDFVPYIAQQDFSKDFDLMALPEAISKAMILHKGKLTEPFEYISEYLDN
jgi:alpha-aminoadipic semialdehyde synthase